MTALTSFFHAFVGLISSPKSLLLMAGFVALGILLGALPGISVNMALILALPLTYTMDTETAMCVLLACYIGAMSGGCLSAITLNIPGTGSSIATTFDGYPMAAKGQAGKAVGISIFTSFVGGGISFHFTDVHRTAHRDSGLEIWPLGVLCNRRILYDDDHLCRR